MDNLTTGLLLVDGDAPGSAPWQRLHSNSIPSSQRFPLQHPPASTMPPRPRILLPRASLGAGRRTIIAAPRPGSGPLLERRPDRALPSLASLRSTRRWQLSIPAFAALMGLCTLAIFNYQKTNSSVVSSSLYALRTHPDARDLLGDEIYFASQIPWISGEINQLHGRIDVTFGVKGTKSKAKMRFRSERKTRMGAFETLEWSLEMPDGETISLLHPEGKEQFRKDENR